MRKIFPANGNFTRQNRLINRKAPITKGVCKRWVVNSYQGSGKGFLEKGVFNWGFWLKWFSLLIIPSFLTPHPIP